MEGHRGPHAAGALVGGIEDEAQQEERKKSLELKVHQGKKHGRKDAGEPHGPGLYKSAVHKTAEEQFFNKGRQDGNHQKSDGEAKRVIAKEWKVGLLLLVTRQ